MKEMIYEKEYEEWLKENVPELTATEIDELSCKFEKETRDQLNNELSGTFLETPW